MRWPSTDHRLAWLQSNPKTRYSPSGVIAIDNTLVDHSGKLIEDVGWLWDHAHPSTSSGAPRHRSRLPDLQLRLSVGQPLSNRVATIPEKFSRPAVIRKLPPHDDVPSDVRNFFCNHRFLASQNFNCGGKRLHSCCIFMSGKKIA